MTSKKAALSIFLTLAALTAVLWSIDTYTRLGYQCGTDSLEQANKTREVLEKHKELFMRQPKYLVVEDGFLRDEKTGRRTEIWGIVVGVHKKVDQDSLPPDDRIPDELEGVPVQILPAELEGMGIAFVDPDLSGPGQGQFKRALHTLKKHRAFFHRYPFENGVGPFLAMARDELGTNIWGIEVLVSEKVDPRTVPPEDRIPRCLEDIPVIITVYPNK